MRYSFASAAALLVLAAASAATPKHGAVKLDFGVLRRSADPKRLARRAGLAELVLTNEQTYYSADLKIGSDGQEQTVLVDTGSLDLWIMSNDVVCESSDSLNTAKRGELNLDGPDSKRRVVNLDQLFSDDNMDNTDNDKRGEQKDSLQLLISAYFGTAGPNVQTYTYTQIDSGAATATAGSGSGSNSCTQDGSFNTDTSDSFKVNSSALEFSITYADGSAATGFWGRDYVSILSANVSDVSFAVVNDTSSTFGVLGIGLEGLETTFSLASSSRQPYTYENFPVRLKNSGAINKVAYSLFLDDDSASSGLVLFGAVDHAKYSGQLTTVPIINIYSGYYDNPIRLDVALDSISFETSSTNITAVKGTMAALLDSGTTYSYFPTLALDSFVSSLSGTYSSAVGLYLVSCNYNTDNAYAVFDFSGATIKVPLSDLVLKYGSSCYLTVLEQTSTSPDGVEYAVLGDNFLRNAYVVYDLEDYQISLAQASYSSDEDIEVISSSVPLAVSAKYYSSTSLSESSGTSEVTKLSSSLLKKSAAQRSSSPQWAMLVVATFLVCFSLV